MSVPVKPPVIVWDNGVITKLGPCSIEEVLPDLAPLLVQGERVLLAFKDVRDYVAFTNKRIIAVNLKGLTGKKRDYTSMPYRKFHLWTIETSSALDQDSRLEVNISTLAKLQFEFRGNVDMMQVAHVISVHSLG